MKARDVTELFATILALIVMTPVLVILAPFAMVYIFIDGARV